MVSRIRRPFAGLLTLLGSLVLITPVRADGVDGFDYAYCSTQNTGSGSGATWNWQSNGWCNTNCKGSAYAITLDKNCWCSDYAPGEGLASTTDCSSTCAGFPKERCGNTDKKLYLYVKNVDGTQPSGTKSASDPTSSSTESSSPSTTSTPSSTPTTAQPSSTSALRTSQVLETSSQLEEVTRTSTPSASSTAAPSTLQTTAAPASPQTNTRVVTENGSTVTHTVVTTPTSAAIQDPVQKGSSTNTGAIVGGVVGGLAGLAAIGAIVFLLLRRRRNKQNDGEDVDELGVRRNVSTMSRSGLLQRTEKAPQYPSPIATNFAARRQSSYMDQDSPSPISGLDRRNSRHMVDQRLNPSALFVLDNSSRGSIASMDDSRDYHRPLNVRNPDPS